MDEKDLISTKSAAHFLNVSLLFNWFVRARKNTYTLVGAHRWISFDDLSVYREKMINNSKAAMDELIEVSQELRM